MATEIMGFVTARGIVHEIEESPYWHLTQSKDFLLHNARLGEGICSTVSALAELPDMQNLVTPYSLLRRDVDKERVFEMVRRQHFGNSPSRDKALFLFVSKADAQRALREWFSQEARLVVETRIVAGGRCHRADARWLDRLQAEWEQSAHRYWAGEMTADPRLEVIVHGLLYFPEWKTFTLAAP